MTTVRIGPFVRAHARAACTAGMIALMPAGTAIATELRWQAAESDLERALANHIADSNIVSDLLRLTIANVRLDPALELSIGAGIEGSRTPSYSVAEHRVRMPYAYFEDAIRAQAQLLGTEAAQAQNGSDDASDNGQAVRVALDQFEYTQYHLLGHALVDDADPAVDATAEAVSTWLMIRGWPNGAVQWLEDVRAFAAASQRLDGTLDDYWHAHALHAERERTLTCWALGADPHAVEALLPAVSDPMARRTRCVRSWQQLDAQMRSLLAPLLATDAPILDGTD